MVSLQQWQFVAMCGTLNMIIAQWKTGNRGTNPKQTRQSANRTSPVRKVRAENLKCLERFKWKLARSFFKIQVFWNWGIVDLTLESPSFRSILHPRIKRCTLAGKQAGGSHRHPHWGYQFSQRNPGRWNHNSPIARPSWFEVCAGMLPEILGAGRRRPDRNGGVVGRGVASRNHDMTRLQFLRWWSHFHPLLCDFDIVDNIVDNLYIYIVITI